MTIIDTNPIQDVIFSCMSNFAYQDALFLSERYHCECNFNFLNKK